MPRKTPDQIARQARDLIEQLNHATCASDIPAPQISATVQALLSLVRHLPQTVDQLGGLLDRQASLDAIRMDNGTNPEAAVLTVRNAFKDTLGSLEETAEYLQRAATPLFSMAAK